MALTMKKDPSGQAATHSFNASSVNNEARELERLSQLYASELVVLDTSQLLDLAWKQAMLFSNPTTIWTPVCLMGTDSSNSSAHKTKLCHDLISPHCAFDELQVERPLCTMDFKDDTYKLPTGFKGCALIVNLLHNHSTEAVVDSRRLDTLFRQLGYNVTSITEAADTTTRNELVQMLIEFKQECVMMEAKSVILYVGYHAQGEMITLANGEQLSLYKDVVHRLVEADHADTDERTSWLSTPKIFLFQGCGPVKIQEGPEHCLCFTFPRTIHARSEGFEGNYYVAVFTEMVAKYAKNEDIATILSKRVVPPLHWNGTEYVTSPCEKVETGVFPYFGKLYFNMSGKSYILRSPKKSVPKFPID